MRRVKLTFPENLIQEPIIARLAREFDVMPNIRRANVEEHMGWLICEIEGDEATVDRALDWVRSVGVQVDLLEDFVEG